MAAQVGALGDVFKELEPLYNEQIRASLAIPKVEPTPEQLSIWGNFEQHAARRGVRAFPSAPALVADYLGSLPDEALEAVCAALVAIHDSVGASNPVATLSVRTILERRLRPIFPRSWNKEDLAVFAVLPIEVRNIIAKREDQRDAALRRAQNQLASERKKLSATEKEPIQNADV